MATDSPQVRVAFAEIRIKHVVCRLYLGKQPKPVFRNVDVPPRDVRDLVDALQNLAANLVGGNIVTAHELALILLKQLALHLDDSSWTKTKYIAPVTGEKNH